MLGHGHVQRLRIYSDQAGGKKTLRKFVPRAVVITLASLLVGFFTAWLGIEASQQKALLADLLAVASVIFGILGVWIAVLDPSLVLEQKPTKSPDERTKLALEFGPLFIVATFVFIAVILSRLVSPFFSTEFLETFWGSFSAGTVIGCLYVLEIGILILTLRPLAEALRKIRQDKNRLKTRG